MKGKYYKINDKNRKKILEYLDEAKYNQKIINRHIKIWHDFFQNVDKFVDAPDGWDKNFNEASCRTYAVHCDLECIKRIMKTIIKDKDKKDKAKKK